MRKLVSKMARFVKILAVFCLCTGIAIFGGFFGRRFLDRQTQLKVMAQFESQLADAHQLDGQHRYLGSTLGIGAGIKPRDGETLAILRLDRLGIKVSIAEGIDKNVLRISAGHFPESAMPGEGNFSIAGHSSRIYTCLFNDMHKAVIGDTILVDTKSGTHKYLISDIRTVDPDDLFVIQDTRESVITIVTCTNSGKNRLIIRGVEV